MKKNRFLNYKFCFTNFWKVLALYDHFWVTYAKKLKKTEICSFSQNFDRELINYSGMWIDTNMRFFAKRSAILLVLVSAADPSLFICTQLL